MNRRQKIIVSVTGIFIVLLALVGLTYGYFLTRIQGNTNSKSITVTTADLKLTYGDGNEKIITGDKIMPNTVIGEKDFTVTNEGDSSSYVVVIDGDDNDENGVTPINVRYATNGTTRAGVSYNQGDTTTFVSNDFVYTLTCKSVNASTGVETGECDGQSFETSFPMNGGVVVGNNIAEGIRHEYVLKVTYLETNKDQTDDMNKTFDARVNIADVKSLNPYTNEDSLAYNIINNSITAKNGTELVATPPSKIAEEGIMIEDLSKEIKTKLKGNSGKFYDSPVYAAMGEGGVNFSTCTNELIDKYVVLNNSTTVEGPITGCEDGFPVITTIDNKLEYEKVLSVTQDDDGISYYYRGAVEDNYVNFAGMCWKIVRIDGNGNTKLILQDKDNTCSMFTYDNWNIEASDGETITMFDGQPIKFGSFGCDYLNDIVKISYLNPANSPNRAMVNAFKYFQTNTLNNKINTTYPGKTLSNYLSSGNWCFNDKIYSDETGTTLLEEPTFSSNFYYDSYVRLYGKSEKEPTLKCPVQTIEKYGDNITPMYVGALTADEIVYAGQKVNEKSLKSYLGAGIHFWTLSPSQFVSGKSHAFRMSDDRSISSFDIYDYYVTGHSDSVAFRPSILLKSGIEITDGEGTMTDPYIIG